MYQFMEARSLEVGVLAQTYADVQQRFTGIDDLAHGWEHVSRVYALALSIAEQEQADGFIVGMAALLHDLGRTVPQDENEQTTHHADLSVALATELLEAQQIPADRQQAILHAIVAHSFSRGIEPLTLEARIVRDADRLDGLGAIGILRWAITGAVRRTVETKSYDPADPFAEHRTPDDKQYMLDHFYAKLLKLSETMTTETGRALALHRTGFMRVYLEEFRKELEVL